MRKVVINDCYGGFSLSSEAIAMLKELGCAELEKIEQMYIDGYTHDGRKLSRDNPLLIQVIEKIGVEAASGRFARLKIVEIPEDVEWVIQEYDGNEWISEKHRTWS